MDMSGLKFPYEIKPLDSKTMGRQDTSFFGLNEGDPGVTVGPKDYLLPERYKNVASKIFNMPMRSGDVIGAGYSRTGSTWCHELTWLIGNDLDFDKAKATPFHQRFIHLEYDAVVDRAIHPEYGLAIEDIYDLPSPRYLKTHLPLSLLPHTFLDKAKTVYIARDPRDVAVSMYHVAKSMSFKIFKGDFVSYWDLFSNNLITSMPYIEHVKEAWEKRHHPNMLFFFYEELIKDLPGGARRIANFLGKQLTEDQINEACKYVKFENLKKNKSIYPPWMMEINTENNSFIRKGKSGGWRDFFDDEMALRAERWIADSLRDSDLLFPQ